MKKIEQFTNQYSLQKTLRFKLIPVGDTQKNFELNRMLEQDKERAENYSKVKKIIDRYHRIYIEKMLSRFNSDPAFLDAVCEYAGLYYKHNKDDDDKTEIKEREKKLRALIARFLQSGDEYKDLFGQDLIKTLLPEVVENDEERTIVESFRGFSTYFTGFSKNRRNMYTDEEKATAISYRCINDNLPKFLDNAKIFMEKNLAGILFDKLEKLNDDFSGIYGTKIEDIFSIDYFPFVLSQRGIEAYNSFLGGYSNSDGSKIQGLNEFINLYNQSVDKTSRIPQMKLLFKQILSEKNSISFIPETFNSDDEVLFAVKSFFEEDERGVSVPKAIEKIEKVFNEIYDYNTTGIFVKNSLELTTLCSAAFGYWGTVQNAWNEEYDLLNKYKDTEKYRDTRKKAYKAVESFSLAEIQKYADMSVSDEETIPTVSEWVRGYIVEKCKFLIKEYETARSLIDNPYRESKRLYNNDLAIEKIKNALDSVKELEKALKMLIGTGKEENKDERFYGDILPHFERLCEIDGLYDKVRNYMTQKPYKTDKIKLNFQNPQFLGGWDRNKESDYSAVMLCKNGNYYIAVMAGKRLFENIPSVEQSESVYKKMIYKLLPGPNKMLPKVFFSKRGIETFNPPKEILEKYDLGTHKTGDSFNIDDCHRLIDYFKYAISIHPDWKQFGFCFSKTSSYKNIADFYNEVKNQGYKISFCDVPESYIDTLVSEGKLYLFQIYNKDFSQYSGGKPNLHTLYFKMLFDEENLKNVVFKLNGESEMFYREASISKDEMVVHPKNQPLNNKNKQNEKKSSTFAYDIIKDKRYTVDQFMIHIPITINFSANGNSNINLDVREALKDCDNNYVIGIDRGERNLLYVSVVNSKGGIIEQYSLNDIVNEYKGNTYKTDYHSLLDNREKERLNSRTNWKTVESIKELKEGYISQVVHKICRLVEKYDAIIVMEDLNFGFKRVRGGKFEKSVYQKFEKMLIDKLNYLVFKEKNIKDPGSVLRGLQLANQFESFNKLGKQTGFIFYVPAYLTSKIDPVTGFADFIHPRYESVSGAIGFIKCIDEIFYNSKGDYFEFGIDYAKFPKCVYYGKNKWTVCTFGNRIENVRSADKNNEWDSREINLTEKFKELFSSVGININSDIKTQVLSQSKKDFFVVFMRLLALTLQMRNSETGNKDIDYLISPVKNGEGEFYCSNNYKNAENSSLPKDADANGAYNIARKGLWIIDQLKKCNSENELKNAKLAVSNSEWIDYVQGI